VKTEASKKPIPLDEDLIAELLAWRKETPYAADSDFVFASAKKKGKQPYWMSKIMQLYIKSVAAKLGVPLRAATLSVTATRRCCGRTKIIQK
jgi:hypothetical protein